MNKEKIAKNLRDLRAEKNVSTYEVAKTCGISPQAITMYETGNRIPCDDIKLKLANYYKKTIDAIFFN